MMRLPIFASLAISLAGPAAALSCLRPTVETSFAAAHEAAEEYVIAVGSIRVDPGQKAPPVVGGVQGARDLSLTGRVTGRLATLTGFDRSLDAPVTVEIGCAGPWCGSAPSEPSILFLQRTAEGYVLPEGPCPVFSLPLTLQDDMEGRAMACLTGTTRCDSLVPAE
ncbi:MAG: hypothetical protein AAF919_14920 [Pseudomonadota bacterium]